MAGYRRWIWFVAGLVAACSSPVAPSAGPPTSGAPSQSAGPTTTAASTTSPAALSYAPGPAWQSVLDGIGADGSVSKDTALQAFSLAFGPLPGVTLPAG